MERDTENIDIDHDRLLDQDRGRDLIPTRDLILEGIRIVIIATIFLFVEVNMSFLARSLYRGLSIRQSALCAANVRWFSEMTEEKRVWL